MFFIILFTNLKLCNILENSRLSVVFVIRKLTSKIDTIKIYASVTVDGKRAEFNLNRELSVSLWDEKRKRGKGFSKYVISLNKYLDQVFTRLHEAHRQLLQEEVDITSAGIKARYLGEDKKCKTLLDLITYLTLLCIPCWEEGKLKNNFKIDEWNYYNLFGKLDSTRVYTLKDAVDVCYPHYFFNKNKPCY